MATITVRIDPEIEKRMKKYSYINWSEVVGKAIIEKLRRKAPKGWDSTEVIKLWEEKDSC